jgi:hypothetical protein
MGAADSFIRTFTMLDDWHDRKRSRAKADQDREYQRQRQGRLDKQAEARNKQAAALTDLQIENNQFKLRSNQLDQASNELYSIVSDGNGGFIDPADMQPERLQRFKQALPSLINNNPALLAQFKESNPNRHGVSAMNIARDQSNGKNVLMFDAKMGDGSVKPVTRNSSADPNDPVETFDYEQFMPELFRVLSSRSGGKFDQARQHKLSAAKTQADRDYAAKQLTDERRYKEGLTQSDRRYNEGRDAAKYQQAIKLAAMKQKGAGKSDWAIKDIATGEFSDDGTAIKRTARINPRTGEYAFIQAPEKPKDSFDMAMDRYLSGQGSSDQAPVPPATPSQDMQIQDKAVEAPVKAEKPKKYESMSTKDIRKKLDRNMTAWSRYKNSLNPAKTKKEALSFLTNNMQTFTPKQRKKAQSLLDSME